MFDVDGKSTFQLDKMPPTENLAKGNDLKEDQGDSVEVNYPGVVENWTDTIRQKIVQDRKIWKQHDYDLTTNISAICELS